MTPSYTDVYNTDTLLPGACYLLRAAIEEIEYQLVELARSLDLQNTTVMGDRLIR